MESVSTNNTDPPSVPNGGAQSKQRSSSSATGNNAGTTTATSTNSNTKRSTVVIPAAAFIDTMAILTLFILSPSICMVVVHVIFIATGMGFTKPPSNSSSSSYISPSLVTVKSLVTDFILAIVTLYLCPQLQHSVMMFAHSWVAASLGGGNVTQNSMWAAVLAELAYYCTTSVNSDHSYHHNTHHSHHHHHPHNHSLYYNEDVSFNTLTSAWSMIPTAVRTIRRIDWTYEFPLICFQMVAIQVILHGLYPFLRRYLPDKPVISSSSSASSSTNNSGNNNENNADSWPLPPSSVANVTNQNGGENSHDNGNTPIISFSDTAQSIDKSLGSDLNILSPPKRNKRLAQVRANQPLWSTLASSMVLAARQESDRIKRDDNGKDSAKTHKLSKNKLGSTSSGVAALGPYSCLVRHIQENVVAFEMIDFDVNQKDSFVIKVNGIQWPQVSTYHAVPDPAVPFLVVVHGLTPMTQYDIEIILDQDESAEPVVVQRVNVCTSASTANNNNNNSSNNNSKKGSNSNNTGARPLSPVTTLLDTLTTMQMNLSEEKSRFKRAKREHQKRLSSLRGEIDGIKSKIDSADKGDERNRRKVLSLRESVRQFEEEIADLTATTDNLLSNSQQNKDDHAQLQSEHDTLMDQARANEQKLEQLRLEWSSKIGELESDLTALNAKREKLGAKKVKLNTSTGTGNTSNPSPSNISPEIATTELDSSNTDESVPEYKQELQKEIERRREHRNAKLERRRTVQDEFSNSITKMESTIDDTKRMTANLWVSLQQVGSSISAQHHAAAVAAAATMGSGHPHGPPPPHPSFGSQNVSPRDSFS